MEDSEKRQYDKFLVDSFLSIIENFKITTYIETGFRDAYILKKISEKYPSVELYGAEVDANYFNSSIKFLNADKNKNVKLSNCPSVDMIDDIEELNGAGLFFLDANCGNKSGSLILDDELLVIQNRGFKQFVLCIHDFKSENLNLKYNGVSDIKYISEFLSNSDVRDIRYNQRSEYGLANVGVGAVFIFVGIDNHINFQPF